MRRNSSVDLGNLILSLSDALDLASPALSQHQQRTAFIAWELGKAAGLSAARLERVFIAALLHDIGALSLEEKVALRTNQPVADLESHCIRGEVLLRRVPWLEETAPLVRHHHREWQQWQESIGQPLVFEAQLLFIADSLEREIERGRYILHVNETALAAITKGGGSLFHGDLVALLVEASRREEFWLELDSPRLATLLLERGPFTGTKIAMEAIMPLAELFRNIIDFRCRFTSTHSSGVAAAALMLAEIFGLSDYEVQLMQIAGNLHDIGKLAIPNAILDKPGPLLPAEFALIKAHPFHTYGVLARIGGLNQIAEWAASHHERLDGSGYPFRCQGRDLSAGARIMAVADIFTALAEDRPYRPGMSDQEILRILKQYGSQGLLDHRIIGLLTENLGDIKHYVGKCQSITREFYQNQFAFLAR